MLAERANFSSHHLQTEKETASCESQDYSSPEEALSGFTWNFNGYSQPAYLTPQPSCSTPKATLLGPFPFWGHHSILKS